MSHLPHYCTLLRFIKVFSYGNAFLLFSQLSFSRVPQYYTFVPFIQIVCLTFLITTHFLLFIQVVCLTFLITKLFTLYTGCLFHVPHYYKHLLFIQVVCLTFVITTYFLIFIQVVCLTFPITTHFLLFIQVVCLIFLIITHVSSLYRLFVSRSPLPHTFYSLYRLSHIPH
jgi:hypothetical protein